MLVHVSFTTLIEVFAAGALTGVGAVALVLAAARRRYARIHIV